jgi:hypothetical protein
LYAFIEEGERFPVRRSGQRGMRFEPAEDEIREEQENQKNKSKPLRL